MTTDKIKQVLKSRLFKLTNHRNETYTFRFTEVHIFRQDDPNSDFNHVSDYEIEEVNGHYNLKFSNVKNNISTVNFKNVLLVSDDFKVILNYDSQDLQGNGKIQITLVGL